MQLRVGDYVIAEGIAVKDDEERVFRMAGC
jgi:hypothetical protein